MTCDKRGTKCFFPHLFIAGKVSRHDINFTFMQLKMLCCKPQKNNDITKNNKTLSKAHVIS